MRRIDNLPGSVLRVGAQRQIYHSAVGGGGTLDHGRIALADGSAQKLLLQPAVTLQILGYQQ